MIDQRQYELTKFTYDLSWYELTSVRLDLYPSRGRWFARNFCSRGQLLVPFYKTDRHGWKTNYSVHFINHE